MHRPPLPPGNFIVTHLEMEKNQFAILGQTAVLFESGFESIKRALNHMDLVLRFPESKNVRLWAVMHDGHPVPLHRTQFCSTLRAQSTSSSFADTEMLP